MKLTYRRCGDYYLPNIGIPAEDMRPLASTVECACVTSGSIGPSCSISSCCPVSS